MQTNGHIDVKIRKGLCLWNAECPRHCEKVVGIVSKDPET